MTINYQPGRYRCSVDENAFQVAKTGKPMIVLKVRPEAQLFDRIGASGEPYTEEEVTSQQYPRTVRIVINENNEQSLDFAMRKLRHAGFTGSSFDQLDLRGKDVVCDCKHETYEGNLTERWDLPLPDQSRPLENDPSIARKLNAIFGKRLTTNGGIATPPQHQPQAAVVGAADDDDIPF